MKAATTTPIRSRLPLKVPPQILEFRTRLIKESGAGVLFVSTEGKHPVSFLKYRSIAPRWRSALTSRAGRLSCGSPRSAMFRCPCRHCRAAPAEAPVPEASRIPALSHAGCVQLSAARIGWTPEKIREVSAVLPRENNAHHSPYSYSNALSSACAPPGGGPGGTPEGSRLPGTTVRWCAPSRSSGPSSPGGHGRPSESASSASSAVSERGGTVRPDVIGSGGAKNHSPICFSTASWRLHHRSRAEKKKKTVRHAAIDAGYISGYQFRGRDNHLDYGYRVRLRRDPDLPRSLQMEGRLPHCEGDPM